MGQQCCQGLNDENQLFNKGIHVKFQEFKLDQQFDRSIPILNHVQDIENTKCYKHVQYERYFLGNWQDGRADGFGVLYIPNSLLYTGDFYNGMPSGKGKMSFFMKKQHSTQSQWNETSSYEGYFVNGKADGKGTYINDSKKFKFEGSWENSKPMKGTLVFYNHQNIDEIKILDFYLKQVLINYKDGRSYQGTVDSETFAPEGQGQIHFPDHSFYRGGWKAGKMHGKGVYQWKDGSKYEGQYYEGKKEGTGRFYYTSGKIYEGTWADGKQQGEGVLMDRNRNILKEGEWNEGKFSKQKEKSSDQCGNNY